VVGTGADARFPCARFFKVIPFLNSAVKLR
jgi:hypothetical protein